MDDDEVDLNQDWFFDAAEQQTNQARQATPPSSQQNGGRGEYSSLNVPLDDDFGSIQTSQQIMPGTSTQQVVYHQQVNVQQQQVYQPVDNYDDSQQNPQMRMQQQQVSMQRARIVQQQGPQDNYGYSNQPQQPYQMNRPQQQTQSQQDWDIMPQHMEGQMIQRPDSQLMQRPDSQMMQRPDSQMHNQGQSYHQMSSQPQQQSQYYQDQGYSEMQPRSSNDPQAFGMQQQLPMSSNQGNRVMYKQEANYASTSSNAQYSSDGQYISNQQQGTVYVQQSFQSSSQGPGQQRLSSGGIPSQMDSQLDMIQMQPVDPSTSLAYNITPPSAASKKPPPQRSQQQTGKARKGPSTSQQLPQMIIQQQMPPQMQEQFVSSQLPQQASKAKRKPPKKAPTIEEITYRFTQMGDVRFDTQEQTTEFGSILMTLSMNPNASADERFKLSERLDNLLTAAAVSQKSIQATVETKPRPPSKSRKKPPTAVVQQDQKQFQIETQPIGYVSNQQPQQMFANQPAPQMGGNTKTIILDYAPNNPNAYSIAGPSTTYTQVPMQQSQSFAYSTDSNQQSMSQDQPPKKPARRRPPKKTQAQMTIQTETLPTVIQTTQMGGQQILIMPQTGTSNMQNTPVMISYTGANGQPIYLQYQTAPAIQAPQPMVETPKEVASKIEHAKTCRQKKVAKFFDDLHDKLETTDYISPFKGMADIVDRLLPFAFNYEPDYSQEYLDKVDHEMLRRFVHLDNRFEQIDGKLRKIYINEAVDEREHDYELNMLLYLDGEYERRRLEQDKLDAKKDSDDFLRDSDIIRAGVDLAEVEFKKQQLRVPDQLVDPQTSSYGTYEYNEFDENSFTHVEVTPQPSPPKPKVKTNKKREKSKYLYASDLEDSDSDEEDDEEEKTSDNGSIKRDKPSPVTELIDLNAINAFDTESESLVMPPTPDAATRAANEQTEAIDKALELLPHDLENVIPFIFDDIPGSKGLPFDLPLSLQQQPSASFTTNMTSASQSTHHQQSPAIQNIPSMSLSNPMMAASSSSFGITSNPTSAASLPPHSTSMQSPFGQQFVSMKTPPTQQQKPVDFHQQQVQMNFMPPTTSSNVMSQLSMQKEMFASINQPQHTIQSFMPTFNKSQQQMSKEMPPILPAHLSHQLTQQQSPINLMKPPPISKPPTTNNNIMQNKMETSQMSPIIASQIPKFKPINSAKNPLLNDQALKMQSPSMTSSSILTMALNQQEKSPANQPITTMASIQQEKSMPKPLEPPGAFDAPHVVHSYQTMTNLPSLKQRLLQQRTSIPPELAMNAQLMRQLQANQMKAGQSSSSLNRPVKLEEIQPQPTTTEVNRPELAAVSKIESIRMLDKAKQKLQEKKYGKLPPTQQESVPAIRKSSDALLDKLMNQMPSTSQNKQMIPISTPAIQQPKQKLADKRPPKLSTAGMEDSDDEGAQPKRSKTHHLSLKLDPPAPLDVTSSHTSAICRPSPTTTSALPIRLRFKVGHNQSNSSNGESTSASSTNQQKAGSSMASTQSFGTPKSSKTSEARKEVKKEIPNEAQQASSKSIAEKELKRQHKQEKKLRKEQKKLEKKRRKEDEQVKSEPVEEKEVKPLKLKIKFGPSAPPGDKPKPIPPLIVKQPVQEPRVEKLKLKLKLKRPDDLPKANESLSKKHKKRHRSSLDEGPPTLVAQQEAPAPKVPRLKIKFDGKKDEPSTSKPSKEHKSNKEHKSSKEHRLKPHNIQLAGMPRKSAVATPPTLPVSESPKKLPTFAKPKTTGPTFSLKPISALPKSQQPLPATTSMFGNPSANTLSFFNSQQEPPPLAMFGTSLASSLSNPPMEPIKSVLPPPSKMMTAEPQFSDDEMEDPESMKLKEQTSKLVSSLTKLR